MRRVIVRALWVGAVMGVAGCAGSGGGREAASDSARSASAGSPEAPGSVWGTAAAFDSLRAGGVAILGAVQVNEVDQVRPPLIAALDSVLEARWPDIRVLPYARVHSALDDSTARFLLLGYQLHGRAEPLWLARAAESLRDSARYGVLARVRGARIRTEERDADFADESGRAIEIRVTVLESDVSMHLYDLANRALLDSRELRGVAERAASSDSLPRPERPPIRTWSTPEDRAREAMTPRAGGFPAPPSLDRAVADAIAMFADWLVGSARRVDAEGGGR